MIPIAVSWMDLDAAGPDWGRHQAMLSEDDRARAWRYRHPRDRRRFVARRARLRELLAPYLDRPPLAIRFRHGPHGKLMVEDGAVRFSLAQSGGMALFAIAVGLEVGCDLERRQIDFACEPTAERFFSPEERRRLRGLAPARRAEGFFNCWTRKEAVLKARGCGLSQPLDGFDVSLAPDEPARLLRGCDGWSVRAFEPAPLYHAALVAEGDDWTMVTA